jgi:hypothetical protein
MSPRLGTEPGTVEAAMKPKMPTIARRPLLISEERARVLASSDLPEMYFEPKYHWSFAEPALPPLV